MSVSEVIAVTKALEVVVTFDAKKRIPEEYKGLYFTFFSDYDLWRYTGVWDTKTCPICRGKLGRGELGGSMYIGSKIRLLFPYMRILDANTIGGPEPNGNGIDHPNCRHRLIRVYSVDEPERQFTLLVREVDPDNVPEFYYDRYSSDPKNRTKSPKTYKVAHFPNATVDDTIIEIIDTPKKKHVEQILKQIELLNREHMKTLESVRILNAKGIDYRDDGTVVRIGGYFHKESGTDYDQITIYSLKPTKEEGFYAYEKEERWLNKLRDIARHEFGHHVYRNELDADTSYLWREFWERNKHRMPSSYAKSRSEEGFCESYSWYYATDEPMNSFYSRALLDSDVRNFMEIALEQGSLMEEKYGDKGKAWKLDKLIDLTYGRHSVSAEGAKETLEITRRMAGTKH